MNIITREHLLKSPRLQVQQLFSIKSQDITLIFKYGQRKKY